MADLAAICGLDDYDALRSSVCGEDEPKHEERRPITQRVRPDFQVCDLNAVQCMREERQRYDKDLWAQFVTAMRLRTEERRL